uniref:3-oxo-5-alpha-steroid 4-dehydrogenase C-terminal domain-containing protein n=1 Tax=Gorilla gorilla gorilla TaxID=9595 RepID=A0A2I2Z6U4_GORGO
MAMATAVVEERLLAALAYLQCTVGCAVFTRNRQTNSVYSRHAPPSRRLGVPARATCVVQELPSLALPLYQYASKSTPRQRVHPAPPQRAQLHPPVKDPRFLINFGLWLTGMLINIHSDHILRNLRKTGDTGYKIPRGGLFEYITAGNYFGEIMEWRGYALASWSVQSATFAFFTFCFLSGRAKEHHERYLRKFEEYPKFRKIIIPFLF